MRLSAALALLILITAWCSPQAAATAPGVACVLTLPPGPDNPRNSEGDFIQLKDGRILFVYTHFTGGGGDHDTASLMGRFSSDRGKTWDAADTPILSNEGDMNIMSVSLLRLQNGAIALLYLRKNATDDCRPLLRFSTDEAQTWSDPVECIPDPIGYYVVNNDRLVQLKSGRLIIPAARHALKGEKFSGNGRGCIFLSDDSGKTWRAANNTLDPPKGISTGLQEPLVVELKEGRLMLLARTSGGCQYRSWSEDGGLTWSPAEPTTIISPVSPATVERLPESGDLLMVWNNHDHINPKLKGKRTPLTAALSKDEGQSWVQIKNLETLESGWYCYTAMEIVDDQVLLGHCAGDTTKTGGLNLTQILRVPIAWLYE